MVEQVRRLRRGSQPRPGRPRVTARPYYGGPPGWQSGSDEGGESRRIKGKNPVRYSSERSRGNKSPPWSAGRRARRSQDARRASSARNCYAPLGAPLPRIISGETGKETGTPSPDKTRVASAWLFEF